MHVELTAKVDWNSEITCMTALFYKVVCTIIRVAMEAKSPPPTKASKNIDQTMQTPNYFGPIVQCRRIDGKLYNCKLHPMGAV